MATRQSRRRIRPRHQHPCRRSTQLCGSAAILAAAACCPRPAIAANIYYFNSGGGDWNSAVDPYFAWRFDATGNFKTADFPPGGSVALISQSGTNGIANGIVTFNTSITGTNAINSLTIDSGNALNQAQGTLTIAINFQVGQSGAGRFTMSGGSASAENLYIGASGASTGAGTVTLSGSALLNVDFNEIVGFHGPGVFNHSGGTHVVDVLEIGGAGAGSKAGTYNMSNVANLHVLFQEEIGHDAVGTFNQTGGNHLVEGTLFVGYGSTGTGVLNLSGGSLLANEVVGWDESGVVTQSGGTNNANGLTLGANARTATTSGGNGVYNLNAGSLSMIGYDMIVADGGTGLYNQSAGTVFGRHLIVGNNAFLSGSTNISNGTVQLSGGTLSFSGTATIGDNGNGTFNHSGGTFSTTWLILAAQSNGTNATSSGTYNMSNAATLHVAGLESVGDSGVAVFTQTGGTHTVGGNLIVGDHSSAFGSYNLSDTTGPSTLTVGNLESIGGAATGGIWFTGGAFNQSGGVHTVGAGSNTFGQLFIGDAANATGSYNLSGGSLNVTGAAYIGYSGQGTYNQSGGTATLSSPSGQFIVASNGGASGTATLSAGTLNVAYQEIIGYGGAGSFTQTGGSNTCGYFFLAPSGGGLANGLYSMTNGTLTILQTASIGSAGHGVFNQAGGTVTIGSSLFIGGGGSGAVNLSGGSFSAAITTNNGIITQSGGIAKYGPISGSATGNLLLSGTAHATAASFAQALVNVSASALLTVATNATRFTNTATSLTISGGGKIDIGNHDLRTVDAPATVRGYLISAYTAGQDWSGPGITSVYAVTNSTKYTLAYASGSDQSAQDAGIDVPAGQVLVRPTLTGDADMNGTVDFFDLAQLLGYKYNTGQAATYTDGDLDYSGKVDFFDIVTLLSANYNSGEVFAPAVGSGVATPAAAAPEPGVVVALMGLPLLGRRRRRRGGTK